MIEHELLPEQAVNKADHEERVGRIVRVDGVQAVLDGDVEADAQARGREISVFDEVPGDRLQLADNRSKR